MRLKATSESRDAESPGIVIPGLWNEFNTMCTFAISCGKPLFLKPIAGRTQRLRLCRNKLRAPIASSTSPEGSGIVESPVEAGIMRSSPAAL